MIGWALVAAAAATLVLAAPALGDDEGHAVLARSAEASHSTAYAGEALWITFGTDRPYVSKVEIAASGDGTVVVDGPGHVRLRIGDDTGGIEHSEEGWAVPLLGVFQERDARFAALARNYRVEVEGRGRVLTRPSTVVAFRKRADDAVRERLWIDDEVGLPLRRETYGPGGETVRLGTYLSLDLDPETSDEPNDGWLEERLKGVMPVEDEELEALRKAEWVVPDELPGGYEALGAFTVAADDAQSLQVVYGDGLYTVSVFQQLGSADWDSLPAGAEPVEELPGDVYEWPGALPQRLVWSVDGRTWSIVGDAPPDDMHAFAAALPLPDEPGVVERLRRGFGRLWSGVSQWGRNLLD